MYKIHNLVPEYLLDIVPDMRYNASAYYTRNSQNYNIPVCRLQIYKSSFVPTVVNEWNSLPLDIRDSSSLSLFKNKISNSLAVAPPYFSYGKRRTNILHTRLRQNCALNIDLYRCNIITSPLCSCGKIEDAHHFFFSCPKYATVREEFLINFLDLAKFVFLTHVPYFGETTHSAWMKINTFFQLFKFIFKVLVDLNKHKSDYSC